MWSTCNDFLFYLTAPLITVSYLKLPKFLFGIIFIALFSISCYWSVYQTKALDLPIFQEGEGSEWFLKIYINPIARYSSYLTGFLFGLSYYSYKQRNNNILSMLLLGCKRSKAFAIILTCLGVCLMGAVFTPYLDYNWGAACDGGRVECHSLEFRMWYNALHRPVFCIGVGLVSTMLISQVFFRLNEFICNTTFMTVVPKLTYMTYLYHPFVIITVWLIVKHNYYSSLILN